VAQLQPSLSNSIFVVFLLFSRLLKLKKSVDHVTQGCSPALAETYASLLGTFRDMVSKPHEEETRRLTWVCYRVLKGWAIQKLPATQVEETGFK
jgi:hypothetical protein